MNPGHAVESGLAPDSSKPLSTLASIRYAGPERISVLVRGNERRDCPTKFTSKEVKAVVVVIHRSYQRPVSIDLPVLDVGHVAHRGRPIGSPLSWWREVLAGGECGKQLFHLFAFRRRLWAIRTR